MARNFAPNLNLLNRQKNSSAWKGATWKNTTPTNVLYNPTSTSSISNAEQAFLQRSKSCKHPIHRPKVPRPQRVWRAQLLNNDSNAAFRVGGRTKTGLLDRPGSLIRLTGTSIKYENGKAIKEAESVDLLKKFINI